MQNLRLWLKSLVFIKYIKYSTFLFFGLVFIHKLMFLNLTVNIVCLKVMILYPYYTLHFFIFLIVIDNINKSKFIYILTICENVQ